MNSDPVYFDRQWLTALPWKNGKGETREVIAWPPGAGATEFDWRASIATIDMDGPFSLFTGIDRSITLLDGAGVHLLGDGPGHALTQPLLPFAFPGERVIQGVLAAGPCTCFNIMTRRGRHTAETRVIRERCVIDPHAHGVLLVAEGRWQATFSDTHRKMGASLCPGQGYWWAEAPGGWQLDPLTETAAILWVKIGGEP